MCLVAHGVPYRYETQPATFLGLLSPFFDDTDEMLSKDASFQVMASAPDELRVTIKERSLDKPGVRVVFIEDVLEETAPLGTPTAEIVVAFLSLPLRLICVSLSSLFPPQSPSSAVVSQSSVIAGFPQAHSWKRVRSKGKAKKMGGTSSAVEGEVGSVHVKQELVGESASGSGKDGEFACRAR